MSGRVAVLFDRLGPYHLARLRAASAVMPVFAVELCGESADYAWDPVEDQQVPRVTLFPGRDSQSLPSREVRKRLAACLDDERPRVVLIPGWGSTAALAALDWCKRRGCPAVIMSESTATDELRRPWKEWIKRRIVRLAAAGLVGGTPHRDYLRALGMPWERIYLGYDAVDSVYFESGAAEAQRHDDSLRNSLGLPASYFLASNRFVEKKNLSSLLTAYDGYRRDAGDAAWHLVLLGDGPLRAPLEKQRTALGLGKHVVMPGFKQYEELPAYYALAKGFIHASTSEQWGLVVNEAMASGLPVLVSERCGCAADLVTAGGNGWTFDPTDIPAMSNALRRLAALPSTQRAVMGIASQERIADWGSERFAKGAHDAVEAALAEPARAYGALDRCLLGALLAAR